MESETKMPPNPARQIREPSLTLTELVGLFRKSAGDENLDMPSRELAARMCVLARHIELLNARLGVVHGKMINGFKAYDKALAEQDKALAELIETLRPVLMEQAGQGQVAPQDAAPKDDGDGEVDDEAEQLIARAQKDAASDVAEMEAMARAKSAQRQALPPAQQPPPPPPLPVQQAAPAPQPVRRANKKNGGAA